MTDLGHCSELMQGIVKQNLRSNLVIVGLGIIFLFGGGYALAPEHGKTMVKAAKLFYQAMAQQALISGLVTTIAHTASIFVIGLLTLFASQYVVSEQLYPILSFICIFTICCVSFWLHSSRLNNQPKHNHQNHHRCSLEAITLSSPVAVGIARGI
ncbi:MAG: hypothetical protein AAF915_10220 [Cyanobacteria bacterium P01_D01_bin.50]